MITAYREIVRGGGRPRLGPLKIFESGSPRMISLLPKKIARIMMGYVTAISACIGCNRIFSYNPLLVPSCSAVTGQREPICQTCVDRINPLRIANGLDPIVPLPGAYEACEEGELP